MASAALALGLAACGGKEQSPDIDEATGSATVEAVRAEFPARQRVSRTADLRLTLRNTGDTAVPQLAVTVWTGDAKADETKPAGSFSVQPDGAGADGPARPVWLLAPGYPKPLAQDDSADDLDGAEEGGAEVAQTDTYTFGELAPGASRTIVWRVTAVRPGRYAVNYSVAGGVGGPAKVVDDQGRLLTGTVRVDIDDAPPGCIVEADGTRGDDC